MEDPIREIHELLKKYFNALYFGDTKLFSEIFHPKARLFSAAGDKFLVMDFEKSFVSPK